MNSVNFELNGHAVNVETRPGESLLSVLRDRLHITSPKDACAPQGQCGCCVILVDGTPKASCAVPAVNCQGKRVVTLEGLSDGDRAQTARAFTVAAGAQCGFCIPGIAMRAQHLLDKNPDPSRAEIARSLDGHLCRCTGYTKIIDSIELLGRARRGEEIPEISHEGHVGQPYARHQSEALTLGERPFVADMQREGLLCGALTLSAHPRAKVLAIDTTKARAVPGVHAVVTAADVPGDRWVGLLYADWPVFVAVGEEVRYVGDVLAAVAADDEFTARAAAALVEVAYEVLPPILDPLESLKPGATQVNPKHVNLLGRSLIERGDVEAALAASAHVASGTWRTQRIDHLFLETECALAEPLPDGRLALYTQGQGVFEDQRQVARLLAVPESQVVVELIPPGGAFGGKEDMSVQGQAALLAKVTGRPVRVRLNREESIRLHPKRHPITLDFTVGCDADGRLTALKAVIVGDSGAYASVGGKVLERAAGHACGPYRVGSVRVEAFAAYTNNPPCGAMRGFGANQSAFAIDGALDMLAKKVGIDGWEIRERNVIDPGDVFVTGQIMDAGVGVRQTLHAVKDEYYAAKAAGKAVGIACGIKNSGLGNGVLEWGKCRLVVRPDQKITLYNPFTEMGQGLFTVLAQFACEVTGLPADTFVPVVDSTFELGCGQTTGSRATLLGGRAVMAAAKKLKVDLAAGKTLAALSGEVYAGDILIDDTTPLGTTGPKVKTHTAFSYATQLCILDETGRIERFVAAHDAGRVVNPALCTGQIEGSIHMGLGYALTEEMPCEDGMPVTFSMREIGVLRARDMPEITVILVEVPAPEGPMGAKGVGEIGLVPTAAAVAGALEAFDGVRRMTLPMKDSPAGRAMSVGKIRRPRGEWH
jgi:selenium-dependent xanthine dehydrogenase